MTSENEFSENTTKDDLLKEFRNDLVVKGVLQMIATKANQDRDVLLEDFAVLLSARMNYLWGKTMDEEEKEMEGIEHVTEKDVDDLYDTFQTKYRLTDEYVEHLRKTCIEHINEETIERSTDANASASGVNKIRKNFYFLRIFFLPITAGIMIFGRLYDPRTGNFMGKGGEGNETSPNDPSTQSGGGSDYYNGGSGTGGGTDYYNGGSGTGGGTDYYGSGGSNSTGMSEGIDDCLLQ